MKIRTKEENRTTYIYIGQDDSRIEIIPGQDGVTEAMIDILHSLDDKEITLENREGRDRARDFYDENGEYIDPFKKIPFKEPERTEPISSDVVAFELLQKEALNAAVNKLKPKQKDLIEAIYLNEETMSQAEYAKKKGLAESSVNQSAWRARARLKELINTEIKEKL